MIVRSERFASDYQRVTGAALLFLHDKINSGVLESLAYAIGLVPDDGVDVRSRNYLGRGGDHVRQKRLASDFVEDFGVLGFESCAFAGSHDGDGDAGRVGCGHRVQYSASDSRQSLLVASPQSLAESKHLPTTWPKSSRLTARPMKMDGRN